MWLYYANGRGVKVLFSYLFFLTCIRCTCRDLMGRFFAQDMLTALHSMQIQQSFTGPEMLISTHTSSGGPVAHFEEKEKGWPFGGLLLFSPVFWLDKPSTI